MSETPTSKSHIASEDSIPQASLESILCTEELQRRPSRPPDYEKENRALVRLASTLSDSPTSIFQTLAETILDITQCDSAGLSLLTRDGKTPDVCGERFYWPAIAGMWNPHVGGGTPRNFGPCGDVLDQNRTLLFRHFERRYPYLLPVIPAAEECLLVPFCVSGEAVGTIWAIMHDDRRKFDAEDDRVMASLGKFASSAYQARMHIEQLKIQVTEREKAEAESLRLTDSLEEQVRARTAELQGSEERLRLAQQAALIGAFDWNIQTGVNSWTREMEAMYGLPPGGFSGTQTAFENLIHPDDRAEVVKLVDGSLKTGQPTHGEWRVVWADGSVHWIAGHWQVFMDESGKPSRVIGINMDISERKLAEKTLRDSEERFRLAAQAGKMFAYEWDVATDVIVRSPEAARILGIDEGAQVSGQQIMAQIHPDDRARLTAAVAALSPEKPYLEISYRMVPPDGRVIWVERNSRAHFDEQGRMLRVVGMVADVTDRKLAEEARLQHAVIVESSEDAIAAVTLDGVIASWNEGSQHMFGYTENEAVGKPVTILVPPELPDEENKILETVKAGGRIKQFESIRVAKTGKRINVSLSISPIKDSTGKIVGCAGIARDITERKQAEDMLREYERAVELSEEAMAVVDRDYRFLIANRKYLRLRKMTKEQVVGHFVHEVLNKGVFEDVVKEKLDECFQGNVVRYEMKYTYPELGERDVLVSYFPIEGANRVDRVASIMQDITDRKQLERVLTDMSRKLIEAQEQERARIARELHDDINQRLAMLAVELEQVKENPSEVGIRVPELRKQLTDLSNDVQALSHDLHSSQMEYLGVVAGMKSWCKEFAARQGIEIEWRHGVERTLPQEIGLCLFRVLQEALHNAAKHSGVKRIEVELSEKSGEIHLTIRDLGKGFDVEAVKQGNGLGLTSMRERVRLVNGTITIDSKPMGGTTIHVRVPFGSEKASERAVA